MRIEILDLVHVEHLDQVAVYKSRNLSTSDEKELTFWANDPGEGPDADIFENTIYKSRVMLTFRSAHPFMQIKGDERVLEVGAGQGWASVMLKRRFPQCYVVASDVSPHALQVTAKYETLMRAQIDEKWACSGAELPVADQSFDVVFCFAAFHHFVIGDRYNSTLREMIRVLRPGGRVVLLYEPTSPKFLYKMMNAFVNKKRAANAEVDEDVVVLAKLSEAAAASKADLTFEYFPEFQQRLGPLSTFYYFALSKISLLQRVLPCSVNFRFVKQ